MAEEDRKLKEVEELLSWASDHALPSGVLPEQLHPYSGEPLSVSPLTWSHGTFVTVAQRHLRRIADGEGIPYGRLEDWIGKLFTETCNSIYGICLVK